MTAAPPGTEAPAAGPVRTIRRHGAEWRIRDPGGLIGAPIADGRPYEARLLDRIHSLGLAGSALDVGAHVGNHSLFLAAACGLAVVALEPEPRAFAQLRENAAMNPGLDVVPVLAAAGRAWGRARIAPGMRTEPDPAGDVQVVVLDDLVDLPDLALVKVDVEGAEADVLAGLRRHLARGGPVVFAETHTRTAARRVTAELAPLGYRATYAVRMGSVMQCWERRP